MYAIFPFIGVGFLAGALFGGFPADRTIDRFAVDACCSGFSAALTGGGF